MSGVSYVCRDEKGEKKVPSHRTWCIYRTQPPLSINFGTGRGSCGLGAIGDREHSCHVRCRIGKLGTWAGTWILNMKIMYVRVMEMKERRKDEGIVYVPFRNTARRTQAA